MRIRDEIIADLRMGRKFAEIRTKTRSKSQLYAAAEEYLDELGASVENTRAEASEAEEERLNLASQIESLSARMLEMREEEREARDRKAFLDQEISKNTAELNGLQGKLALLESHGFTPEVIGKLQPMFERGGKTLLLQVESIENYDAAVKDFEALRKKTDRATKKLHALEQGKTRAQNSLNSLRNEIDELELQGRSIKEAIKAVTSLMEKGYTTEDIKAIGYAIDLLGVAGNADLSVTRLVVALRRQKNQRILEEKLRHTKAELTELEKAVADTKSRLRVAKECTLESINKAENASTNAIKDMAFKTNQKLDQAYENFDKKTKTFLESLSSQERKIIETFEEQSRRQSDFERQKALHERTVSYGQLLENFLSSDSYLSAMPLQWIQQLTSRIQLWIALRMPEETVRPTDEMCQKQCGLLIWQPYKLVLLIGLLCLGLESSSMKCVKESIN